MLSNSHSDLMLCTAFDHGTICIISNYIQRHKRIFTHIETLLRLIFRLIQAHSAPWVTIAYSQPGHILSPGIFRVGRLFKSLWNVDQAYSEPCYGALFSHIQAYSEHYANLTHAETWHTQNLGIFRNLP